MTDDLKDRLRRHNAGEVTHTSRHRPWRVKTAIAFTDQNQASAFERYLKTARMVSSNYRELVPAADADEVVCNHVRGD